MNTCVTKDRGTLVRTVVKAVSLAGLLACVAFSIWGFTSGLFTSQEALKQAVSTLGPLAGPAFTLIQAVQVVIPIIPGGLGCLAGVVLFGPVKGFIYNYIGICLGSMVAFALARAFGRKLLISLFGPERISRYDKWTGSRNRFAKFFALAIVLPVAPDDFLCYLAGTTKLSWRCFSATIFLCKPPAILAYSLILSGIWTKALSLISG